MLITELDKLEFADFQEGVTILVNKPLEWTSFDVVNKIRYTLRKKLGVKKIKVGHAGTLDPLATGLLIIAIGKDTKQIINYQNLDKQYEGTMHLGATTVSFDAEFEPEEIFPIDHIDENLLEKVRKQFIGVIEQVPPKFSAVKIDGKSAYKLARKGKEFELKKRSVEIFDFDFRRIDMPEIDFTVKCQKGTYIRSLVNDFGKALESGAYLSALNRTTIGDFDLRSAFELNDIIDILSKK
ncbi:MAG TPA: tRNA pseudouridine(55) synthase TruB [Bacteroidetes bacterium]|nr:tRNA pseudouridine(55) synthase TruB [Bacteroidota bacterium]